MHADVAVEIAYSGEFFVRRVHKSHHAGKRPAQDEDANGDAHHGAGESADESVHEHTYGADDSDPSSLPPSAYELVIDNDSGTYRPRKDLLPVLGEFLSRPSNLGALGRLRVMDGFDNRLKRWKEQRKEEKKRARGGKPAVVRQASISSSSSSSSSGSEDADAAAAAAEDAEKERQGAGGHWGKNGDEKKALQEDAERAKANEDEDDAAKREEQDAKGPSSGG